jgi:hypothetical protein
VSTLTIALAIVSTARDLELLAATTFRLCPFKSVPKASKSSGTLGVDALGVDVSFLVPPTGVAGVAGIGGAAPVGMSYAAPPVIATTVADSANPVADSATAAHCVTIILCGPFSLLVLFVVGAGSASCVNDKNKSHEYGEHNIIATLCTFQIN